MDKSSFVVWFIHYEDPYLVSYTSTVALLVWPKYKTSLTLLLMQEASKTSDQIPQSLIFILRVMQHWHVLFYWTYTTVLSIICWQIWPPQLVAVSWHLNSLWMNFRGEKKFIMWKNTSFIIRLYTFCLA